MLMPSDSVSVANTTCNRFDGEAVLHRLAEGGDQAGVVRAHARLEPRRPRPVPEDAQLVVGEPLGVLLAAPRISARSSGVVRRIPSDRHWATASSQAAREKMKTMAGSMRRSSRASMSSLRRGPARRE